MINIINITNNNSIINNPINLNTNSTKYSSINKIYHQIIPSTNQSTITSISPNKQLTTISILSTINTLITTLSQHNLSLIYLLPFLLSPNTSPLHITSNSIKLIISQINYKNYNVRTKTSSRHR